jgi:uncharacterized membrane protein YkgB
MPNKRFMSRSESIGFLLAHAALFIVFVWFGLLKMLALSPATPLVIALSEKTLPFFDPDTFVRYFGAFEVFIGLCFIIPKLNRVGLVLLIPHIATTILPLILLPSLAWTDFLVPTLEGQYIIKNVAIAALAVSIFADMKKQIKLS